MTIGVDVSKDQLVISTPQGKTEVLPNSKAGVAKLLRRLKADDLLAMEATGSYHKLLADSAYAKGCRVIVFNPKDVLHYARSISPRAKTDRVDARVIACYAQARPDHRHYQPTPKPVARLKQLLRTRTALVHQRTNLQNRNRACPEVAGYTRALLKELSRALHKLETEIAPLAKELPQHRQLGKVPGFGPVVTPYLLALLAGSQFASSDAFVAFIGLDLRVRQSGKKQGRCCLSKRGDPEARRLLYLGALAATRQAGPYQRLYQRSQAQGLPKIAALNVVARKLARTAWALYTSGEEYRAERVLAWMPMEKLGSGDEPVVIKKELKSKSAGPARKVAAKRAVATVERIIKHEKGRQLKRKA